MEIILAKPRGFCAGVTRAIETVEKAIEKFGTPVYVRHEIVHNKFVVESLRKKGAIFVNEVEQIPVGAITIFSAHGVSDKVEEDALNRGLDVIDATCPLVSKVHREAKKYEEEDYEIILIGHRGHPEVEGTSGRVKKPVILVTNEEDARNIEIKHPEKIAYVSQTTLSVDDTKKIVEILENRFPTLQKGLATKDICYATQNRQEAIKAIAPQADLVIVVGSQNSSNSVRLAEVALEYGAKVSHLIDYAEEIQDHWFNGVETIGLTSGASVPEILVTDVLKTLAEHGYIDVETITATEESLLFALPPELRKDMKAAGI